MAGGGLDAWRKAVDTVAALEPRRIVESHQNKDLDDDAARLVRETRQYLDDAEDGLADRDTPEAYFHAMLDRYPRPPRRDRPVGRRAGPLSGA
ncbi:hypothetical protein JHN63_29715 [Streptomyces sp. MBT65]|uniref:hypothetical protein n=1 Tax=Streptomyces sp. MBT65 TaxID=1488395 RepID=UPI00190AAC56|nr:hypothetical protein [Streptomyces sp. MBT65]MBK3577904.1 hypothetical protein [Streptomyces sp. MBT65]